MRSRFSLYRRPRRRRRQRCVSSSRRAAPCAPGMKNHARHAGRPRPRAGFTGSPLLGRRRSRGRPGAGRPVSRAAAPRGGGSRGARADVIPAHHRARTVRVLPRRREPLRRNPCPHSRLSSVATARRTAAGAVHFPTHGTTRRARKGSRCRAARALAAVAARALYAPGRLHTAAPQQLNPHHRRTAS